MAKPCPLALCPRCGCEAYRVEVIHDPGDEPLAGVALRVNAYHSNGEAHTGLVSVSSVIPMLSAIYAEES